VVEELTDQYGVNFLYPQSSRRPAESACRETEKKAEGIAVTGYRSWTGVELREQPVGEEALQERGKIWSTHR
jgi:hypothetical protein